MPSQERTPYERETLIFPDTEKAQTFSEKVQEGLRRATGTSKRAKDVVADELSQQFVQEGEAVSMVRKPWEHTPAEHAEVQQLVDVAFAKDLSTAIRQAKKSNFYPRNLDLLHDVLTGELYQLVQQYRMAEQPIVGWLLGSLAVLSGALVIVLVVLLLT